MADGFCFIYSTFKSRKNVEQVVGKLLEESLIVCTNIWEGNSIYKWQGKIEKEAEIYVMMKTKEELFNAAEKIINEMHEYEVPAIAKIPIDLNNAFAVYLNESLNQ